MARFLMLWRANPAAQSIMPTDPSTVFKMHEQWFAAIEDLTKGEFEEFGFFPETREGGGSGHAICQGEAADIFRNALTFLPYTLFEVHKIIPFEKAKETTLAVMKATLKTKKD